MRKISPFHILDELVVVADMEKKRGIMLKRSDKRKVSAVVVLTGFSP
jgi:hypothetical protein